MWAGWEPFTEVNPLNKIEARLEVFKMSKETRLKVIRDEIDWCYERGDIKSAKALEELLEKENE